MSLFQFEKWSRSVSGDVLQVLVHQVSTSVNPVDYKIRDGSLKPKKLPKASDLRIPNELLGTDVASACALNRPGTQYHALFK